MTRNATRMRLVSLRMAICDIMQEYGDLPENVIALMMQSVLHESAAINLTMGPPVDPPP